jgi:hypothetical protein
MPKPIIYVAIAPSLVQELELESQLARLEPVALVERWAGPGTPPPEVVAAALERAQVLFTGWGTPPLAPLEGWTPKSSAVRLVAHTAGTVKRLIPVAALERGLLVTRPRLAGRGGGRVHARRDPDGLAQRIRGGGAHARRSFATAGRVAARAARQHRREHPK